MDFKLLFNLWKKAIVSPAEAFKSKGNLGLAAQSVAIAGIIAGVLSGLAQSVNPTPVPNYFPNGTLQNVTIPHYTPTGFALNVVASTILTPIVSILSLLIFSGILYIFALMLGAKNGFEPQTYNISLYYSPYLIISAILSFIPIAGSVVSFLFLLYLLYPLTEAIKMANNFSTGRAVAVWLLPIMILVLLAVALFAAVFALILSSSSITGGFIHILGVGK